MFRRPVREINAEYRSHESSLPAIQNLVRETCINAGFSRKDVSAVILSIEEGVTNIIRHAYLYEDGVVRIRIVVYNRRIVFSLIDNGRSFQPETENKLDLKKLAESGRKGGLGFYMISKIMDSVEYLSTPGFNELRMTKLITRGPEVARLMMGRMFSLRVKFSIYTFAIMLTIIAGAYLFIDSRTSRSINQHLHDKVSSLSKTVADQANGYILNRRADVEFLELVGSYVRANQELEMIVLTSNDGEILADTRDIRNLHRTYNPPEGVNAELIGEPQRYKSNNERLIYLINAIQSGTRTIGAVHIAYTDNYIADMINAERQKIIFLTIIGLAFGIGCIYLLSNYFVSPIVRIVERVRKFSSGDIETELPLEGVEEFFEITKALNEMMSRLRRDRANIIERERVAKEIEVAGQIQKTLLPSELPDIPNLEVDTFYRAASRISGDLYDVFRVDDKNYCFLVADVSGKGIPASLIMSVLRTVIRIQAREESSSHKMLISVNDYIKTDIPAGIFITIFLGVYNIDTREMNFVSAGHNPLIHFRKKDGKALLINPKGVPLGLPFADDADFGKKLQQKSITIRPGDKLFIYSDGITESMNRAGDKYGLDRLHALFENEFTKNEYDTPKLISERILADIDSYCGMATQADDITFITIISPDKETNKKTGIETENLT
ncbi:MAG: SpoIIE family protein phosphatase [Candidatus Zixiibacteriota bacterium]